MEPIHFEMHGTGWDAAQVAGFGTVAEWLKYGKERFLTLLPAKEQERKLRAVYRQAITHTTQSQPE